MGELITDLDTIKRVAEQEDEANWEFRTFLKCHDWSDSRLDQVVHEINDRVASQIDCTKCGNCCRSLGTQVTRADVERLAKRFGISGPEFRGRYTVKNEEGDTMLAETPCTFLTGNLCSVYEDRPAECQTYPNLHKPRFRSRLMGVIDNAALCPIVFNVFQELKQQMRWKPSKRS